MLSGDFINLSWLFLYVHTLDKLLEITMALITLANALVRQDSVVLVLHLFICPIWFNLKGAFFSMDSHLYTIGALQILG